MSNQAYPKTNPLLLYEHCCSMSTVVVDCEIHIFSSIHTHLGSLLNQLLTSPPLPASLPKSKHVEDNLLLSEINNGDKQCKTNVKGITIVRSNYQNACFSLFTFTFTFAFFYKRSFVLLAGWLAFNPNLFSYVARISTLPLLTDQV